MLAEPGDWSTKRLIASGRTRFLAYLAAVEECSVNMRRLFELADRNPMARLEGMQGNVAGATRGAK